MIASASTLLKVHDFIHSASPGNLLEMQILKAYPTFTESKTLRAEPSSLDFNKSPIIMTMKVSTTNERKSEMKGNKIKWNQIAW